MSWYDMRIVCLYQEMPAFSSLVICEDIQVYSIKNWFEKPYSYCFWMNSECSWSIIMISKYWVEERSKVLSSVSILNGKMENSKK